MPNTQENIASELKEKIINVSQPRLVFWDGMIWIIVLHENPVYNGEETTKFIRPLLHFDKHSHFVVLSSAQFSIEIKKGNLFILASCSKDTVIFNPENAGMPSVEDDRANCILKEAIANFDFGVTRSTAFLEGVAFYFAKNELAVAMFMLHQSAELMMRGILMSLTNHNLRSHSLSEYNCKMKKCIPKLIFLENVSADAKELMEQMEFSYSSARYNLEYAINENDVLVGIQKVKDYTIMGIQVFNSVVTRFKNIYSINQTI